MDAASEFVERNRSAIIERLSAPGSKAAADHLLNEKCISNEDYEKICKSITNEDKVRELYNCMKAGKPKSHFIFRKFLKKSQPYLLDALVRKKRRKRKVISRTSDVQVEKRLRTQEPPATGTGPGPDQNQGQEARDDETDSGSTPDFRRDTLSAMQEYLEDPVKSESMISVLKSKLGEKEMVKLESSLEALMPKRAVGFNHEDFRNISKKQDLTDFLKSGRLAKFPQIVIDQFFAKIRGYNKTVQENHNTAKSSGTKKEPEKSNGFPQNSANGTINNDPSSPTQNSSGVMRAEISKMEMEDSNPAMPVSGSPDSAYETLSQDKPSLSTHNSPQGVQRECETTPTSGDCPELNPEDTGAPNEGRHDGSPQNSANGTINNDPSSPTPNGFGVMRAEVSKMETEESSTAMPVPGFSDSGYNTLNQEKSSLSIHDSTQEDQRECETTPTSGDCPELDLEEAGPENEDWNQNKIVKLKKGPSRQVHEKKMMLKNIALREWALKQIPSEKSGSSQEEELKKIKDAITIVNIKQHPSYPLLLAVNCKVFRDPQTHKCKIIEIPDPDQINKNGQLKEAVDFKVQFHMWLLDISETVVVLKDGNEETLRKSSFEKFAERYQRYLQEVVVPVFAVFNKVQRGKELF